MEVVTGKLAQFLALRLMVKLQPPHAAVVLLTAKIGSTVYPRDREVGALEVRLPSSLEVVAASNCLGYAILIYALAGMKGLKARYTER